MRSNNSSGSGDYKCATGGIGCCREELPTLGAFSEMTGGTRMQRLHERNYSKMDHKAAAEAQPSLLDLLNPDVTETSLRTVMASI